MTGCRSCTRVCFAVLCMELHLGAMLPVEDDFVLMECQRFNCRITQKTLHCNWCLASAVPNFGFEVLHGN